MGQVTTWLRSFSVIMFGLEYMCGWLGGEFPLQTQQLLDLWPVGGGKDTQTCPQEIERAKRLQTPMSELQFFDA